VGGFTPGEESRKTRNFPTKVLDKTYALCYNINNEINQLLRCKLLTQ